MSPAKGNMYSVWIASDQGVSIITIDQQWTIEKKEKYYQSLMHKGHYREGLCSRHCSLKSFGDDSSCTPKVDSNEGLWTGYYLASQSFRYAATKDPEAKKNALEAFGAMEKFLNQITGIRGLPARSFDIYKPGNNWHNSTVFPGFVWKGDTSSDEIVGHLFAYP
jgi:hypothetical protein